MDRKNKRRNFLILVIGQTVSQLGSAMTGFAVTMYAYTKTGAVMASSALAVCSALPYLVVSLFGGAAADRGNKKRIMLVCDAVAAAGSLGILCCFLTGKLSLWVLGAINIVNGFMNAFQGPASQAAVSLLVERKDYVRAGGLQSALGSLAGLLQPVLAAALLNAGGLGLVVAVDLSTFAFAFLTLLFAVKISEDVAGGKQEKTGIREVAKSAKEGLAYLKEQEGILFLFLSYAVLELMGAVSFDSMSVPFLLARTGNDEMAAGLVSFFMAAGCVAASLWLTFGKTREKRSGRLCGGKLFYMFWGSLTCLTGIALFGMGKSLPWWCIVAFFGCFGSPVYLTYRTAILREKVPLSMQGRIFALEGMLTQMLAPAGFLAGALLADHVLEPFMQKEGAWQRFFAVLVGKGPGAGMGLLFVAAGVIGIAVLILLYRSEKMKGLEQE